MYRRRNTRTDQQILLDGDFAKVGRKHFRHVSGTEITYNCNRWAWQISNGDLYTTLEVAVHAVRHEVARV